MVRHHVKKKKGDAKKAASKLEDELDNNLDRFAGSSDEEDDDDVAENTDDDDTARNLEEMNDTDNSDSEDSEDDYDNVYQADGKAKDGASSVGRQTKQSTKQNNDSGESEDEVDSENDYKDGEQDDDDNDRMMIPKNNSKTRSDAKSAMGMSNAMSRILGGQSMIFQPPTASSTKDDKKATTSAKPVILSKTTTPLQRLQQKIKTEEQALRKKRENRRSTNLSAMRLPLAPTAGMSAEKLWKQKKKTKKPKKKRKRSNSQGGSEDEEEEGEYKNENALAIATEIESERTHRRIATRGVVALFNAISKHRAAVSAELAAKEEEKRRVREEGRAVRKNKSEGEDNSGVNSKTKHGFLDMIKKSAITTTAAGLTRSGGLNQCKNDGGKEEQTNNGKHESKSIGWSALKDDFMMSSKLKVSCLYSRGIIYICIYIIHLILIHMVFNHYSCLRIGTRRFHLMMKTN